MAKTDQESVRSLSEESTGALISRTSQQFSRLMREEMRLAQAELAEKGRGYRKGGGLYAGAGLVAVVAFQALVATVIAALALALPVWAAALIVTCVLAAGAALLAAMARREFRRSAPPRPEAAIDSVKADMAEIRERAHS
ncbi:phage holin family protein [Streptomyces marincola]|uniref:phage holin family protein n=1 Tax=Streptomyces marincola TaxID=2878388 RepID=UPI001CF40F23|nr:phage holin family protein [Streptomyces marincola]UCM91082.1 phage holin family protein [Streptomyces marincola]